MKNSALALMLSIFAITTVQAAAPEGGKRADFNQYCAGKAINTTISLKNDGRPIQGTCQIGFKANNPASLERGAMRDPALQNACKGKTKGTAVNLKINGKAVAGKCDIVFKSNMKRP